MDCCKWKGNTQRSIPLSLPADPQEGDSRWARRWGRTGSRWCRGPRWPYWVCTGDRVSAWRGTRPQTPHPRCSRRPSLCPWGPPSGPWSPDREERDYASYFDYFINDVLLKRVTRTATINYFEWLSSLWNVYLMIWNIAFKYFNSQSWWEHVFGIINW